MALYTINGSKCTRSSELEAGLHNAQIVGNQVPIQALWTLYQDGARGVGLVGDVVGGPGGALLASEL